MITILLPKMEDNCSAEIIVNNFRYTAQNNRNNVKSIYRQMLECNFIFNFNKRRRFSTNYNLVNARYFSDIN